MIKGEGEVSIDEGGWCRSQHTSIKEDSGVWDIGRGKVVGFKRCWGQ